jgi:lysophospholipase L1-like esterase
LAASTGLDLGVEAAVGATTAAYWATHIQAAIAADQTACPQFVLVNLGVNDVGIVGLDLALTEAQFKADYATILDAIHAHWPSAMVGCASVWKRGAIYQDALDSVNTWIAAVRADGRSAWTFAGPDEQVWLEGGDNGVTMTTDGVHYSTAGQTENAVQWKAAMGY